MGTLQRIDLCGRLGRLLESRDGMASKSARALCLLLLTLTLCHAPNRRLAQSTEAKGIVTFFQQMTTLSDKARVAASGINLRFNAPIQGGEIAKNFRTIIDTIDSYVSNMEQNLVFVDVDAQLVVAALVEFVKVHQDLLDVVIGKHGLLTLSPFFNPMRQALVSLEVEVDSVAYDLIAVIPTRAPMAQVQFNLLGDTLAKAISNYSTLV